jgi:hypothetical protein
LLDVEPVEGIDFMMSVSGVRLGVVIFLGKSESRSRALKSEKHVVPDFENGPL